MANNFDSNFTRKLAGVFLDKFESSRVLSKNVNTQLLDGKFNPSTGDTTDFRRPTDYVSTRTAKGDISGGTPGDIITGKASGVVQDYFTVEIDYDEADEAIKMDMLPELIAPAATRIKTDFEVDYAGFMMRNNALLSGTYGTPITTWAHVARAGASITSAGVPADDTICLAVNPYTQTSLADNQRSLGAGGSAGGLISEAHKNAILSDNVGGLRVLQATTLSTLTTHSGADRVGTLSSTPVSTYLGAKDTMTQSFAVAGFQANLQVRAGEVLQVTGRNRLNMSTRQPIITETGAVVVYSATVLQDVTLSGTGTGTIVVSGPAIFEDGEAYNTVDSAPISGDVVTLLGGASTLYQPNLFWHKQAFSIGSVPIKKLYSTDTIATTEDGLQIRVSKGASIRENKQIVRFDFRPAYAVLNPFFAGQAFGS